MSTCRQCGKPVEFRIVDGRAIPLHFDGSCSGTRGNSSVERVRRSAESECRKTKCPHCGNWVFFIRHNGGSVWIEPPLGPPWDRHPCLDSVTTSGSRTLSPPFACASLARQIGSNEKVATGVVVRTEISADRRRTLLEVAIGGAEALKVVVNGGADAWLGELVVISHLRSRVYLASDPTYCFVLAADRTGLSVPINTIADEDGLTKKQLSVRRRYLEQGFDGSWKPVDAAHLVSLVTGKDQDSAAHVAAIGILEHAELHGDFSGALALVMSLPPKKGRG